MNSDEIKRIDPFSMGINEKKAFLDKELRNLTQFHKIHCTYYNNYLRGINAVTFGEYYQIPFLPVRLFKEYKLASIAEDDVFKVMTSSGTSGQAVSRIFLDRETAGLQQKILVKIVSDFIGPKRLPMLVLDCPSVVKNRKMFSARGAGILGFSILGRKMTYALNDDMTLNVSNVKKFIEEHKGKEVFLFGFTYMVWEYFYKAIKENELNVDLSKAILIHGGGWKKMEDQKVDNQQFKEMLYQETGIKKVHDYYGMVEQTGCIYMECEYGHLHASVFSDVIIRNHLDFSVCDVGEKGIIQVVSIIPKSYPGHSLITEDEGVLLGEDDCQCGRKGKYFKVIGRIKSAEIRGCSDTHEKSN